MKWLLWLLIIGLGLMWIVRSWRGGGAGRSSTASAPPREPAPAPLPAEPDLMAVCAHCGVHLPQREGVSDAHDRLYCSETHRLAGPSVARPGG